MNRVRPLSDDEVSALLHLHRGTDNADVRSRCDMILWSNEGLSPPKIAQRVRFSRCTVVRYIKRYEAAGIDGLFTKPRPGRPRRVTAEYEARLLETVEKSPRSLGLTFSNWTTANLADYMAQHTDIAICARQVENYLKAHGWRLRRPVRGVKHKQDPELVEEKKTDRRVETPSERFLDPAIR